MLSYYLIIKKSYSTKSKLSKNFYFSYNVVNLSTICYLLKLLAQLDPLLKDIIRKMYKDTMRKVINRSGAIKYILAIAPLLLTLGLLSYQILIVGGAPHIPLILGVAIASLFGIIQGNEWQDIQKGISVSITRSIPVICIFMAVGMTIGSWILSGTVPLFTKTGLSILEPSTFLPMTCIVCAIISVATGTSWGTIGTLGLALLGIGESMGIPAYLCAGAIVSGAWFGDKMSPLSDTTNFAAGIVGTNLYAHIRNMLPTTIPSILVALIIYFLIGKEYTSDIAESGGVELLSDTLDQTFIFNGWLLAPPLVILITIIRKIAPLPGIFMGVVTAGIVAIAVQGATLADVLNVLMLGYDSQTGVTQIDQLLSKGGIMSMMWVISLVMIALAFGGVLEQTGALSTILDPLIKKLNSRSKLVLATLLATFGFNLTSNAFVAYTIPGRMFTPVFRGMKLSSANVSRLLEDGATMTAPLIPWNSGAVFVSGTLGIPTLSYAPFAFANWIAPLIDIFWGMTGWFMPTASDEELTSWEEADEQIIVNGVSVSATEFINSGAAKPSGSDY